jgi:hypothetical protein
LVLSSQVLISQAPTLRNQTNLNGALQTPITIQVTGVVRVVNYVFSLD